MFIYLILKIAHVRGRNERKLYLNFSACRYTSRSDILARQKIARFIRRTLHEPNLIIRFGTCKDRRMNQLGYGKPNVAIFNSSNFTFSFVLCIQLCVRCSTWIQHSTRYLTFNYSFNIQFFIQHSTIHSTFNYSFNIQLFI